ncbi:hypothetical protein V0U79_06140 [Hyphobacterium sp. HN65]|uniref:Uncharacterized protein n=1 Tax=Hyphobacterium lacteum TaxID=3116575 RepID=A0ABU7LQR9_9PROT|nr:hypothetical protein [Hyphobacterium sp. HN65]MEE2525939.1 hypothetical protein [Hyphobacterium sp. HN65]
MILARLSNALRRQDWLAVAIEFVIVVAGVLLAFQISLLSERRAEAARVEAQIDLVAAEMRENLERIRTNIGLLERYNPELRELRVLLSEYSEETDGEHLNRIAIHAFTNPTLELELLALERLESMDGRQLLSNSGVERALRDWRGLYDETKEAEANTQDSIQDTRTGAVFAELSIEAMVSAFPLNFGLMEPVPARFETDWQALSEDPAFAGHLAIMSLHFEYIWWLNRNLEESTEAVLDAIEERQAP